MGELAGQEWKAVIDISAECGILTKMCKEVSDIIAERLLLLPAHLIDKELQHVINNLQTIDDIADFSLLIEQLKDWGDRDNRLFVQDF